MAKLITKEQMAEQESYIMKLKEENMRYAAQNGHAKLALTETYGCQQNENDTERIRGMLRQAGFDFTDDSNKADVVIYNTCAVRENAEDRVFGVIGAMKHQRLQDEELVLGVCGCMVQQPHIAEKIRKNWNFVRAPQEGTVENSVRLSLAFQQKIKERGYDAFSFCDVDGVKKLLKFAPAGALTLLHDEMDIPSVPENDSYGAVTELIMKYLTGKSPAYMEFYEFTKDSAFMGVPDYVPASAVDGKVTVMPNAFGSFGEGLLNVSKVRTGSVTIVRMAQVGGELVIHAVKAEAKTPEKWEEAGWAPPAPQLPSLEVCFGKPSDDFLKNVMSQHYIVTYGDNLELIENYCAINGVKLI